MKPRANMRRLDAAHARRIEQARITPGGCPHCGRDISINRSSNRRRAHRTRDGIDCPGGGIPVERDERVRVTELPPVVLPRERGGLDRPDAQRHSEREIAMRAARKARLAERAAEVRARYGASS